MSSLSLQNLRFTLWLTALSLAAACSNPATYSGANADASTEEGLDVLPTQAGALKLLSVTPDRGPLAGGGQIDVKGVGFADDAKVFLGDTECTIAWRGGKTHLYAIVPPVTAPQTVDVKVQSGLDTGGQPRIVGLTHGYVYLGETHADGFTPTLGPAEGGTQITVHGSGFRPGDKVLVGWREASANEVIDDSTLIALTPPATNMGTADEEKAIVAVRHSSGVAVLAGSFLYGRPPRIQRVDPGVVPPEGADVTLHGHALGHANELYTGGLTADLATGTASEVRGAKIAPMTTLNSQAQPGVRDMLVSSPFGASLLSPAFAYSGPVGAAQLLGVSPGRGPSEGGTLVSLLAALPAGAKVTGVTWDGAAVSFQQAGASVTLATPAHGSGPVSVGIQTDHGDASLPEGFTYVDSPHVDQIQPNSGPAEGGTTVLVTGSHFDGDCTLRIGTWHAQIQSNDGSSIHATTPPGPLGSVDVQVECGGVPSILRNGFQFTDGKPHVNAVVPAQGATGGTTPVTVYGNGFQSGMKFYFGGKPASAVNVLDSGRAEMFTPAHDSGPVNVDALMGGNADTLLNGYNFFDPTAADGGTWGEAIGGTLNITVIDYYARSAIPDATVILGVPGDALFGKYKGFTDSAGQVVFSGPDVVGPLTVTAGKVDYTATSIVSFDAQNATLVLFPEKPSGSGGGEPPKTFNMPLMEGRVRDFEKYISIPPANCLKVDAQSDKTCDTCVSDADCVGLPGAVTFACIDNGVAGKRCLPDCTQANVCSSDFACYAEASLPGHAVCKPKLGIRKVFCATSQRDTDTPNDPPPSGNSGLDVIDALPYAATAVDEATGNYQLTGRLDELAIVCVGGYVTNDTQTFVPTAMGVRRHVFPKPDDGKPGDVITGLDINLDIALTRTLPTRLDHPQTNFPASQGGSQEVAVWLDLGSDGVIPILKQTSPGGTVAAGTEAKSGVQDDVALAHLPMSLPEELADATWIFQGVVTYGDSQVGVPPEAGTRAGGLKTPGDLNLRLRSADGTWSDLGIGVAQELTGVLFGTDDELLIATRRGLLYRGPLDKLKPIYQPVILDPYAAPLAVLAAAGTPTDATFVGELGLIRRLKGQKVTEEAGAVATTLRAVCQNATLRAAVGDKGALEVDVGNGWQQLVVTPAVDLRGVVCTDKGAIAVGASGQVVEVLLGGPQPVASVSKLDPTLDLYALAQTDDGTLWAGGSQGNAGALWQKKPGGQWQEAWPAGANVADVRSLRVLVALPNQTLLAIDREGGQWRVDPTGVVNESPDHLDQRPRAGVALADGSVVLVGEPGLWLGPFLTVPAIASPTPQDAFPFSVIWSAAPGRLPSCNRVHLDGSGYPFWWIYVAPEVTSFALPDLEAIDGISVFPNTPQYQWVARVDRIYVPGTTINSFATFNLEFGTWRSWSTNAVPFHP
jgi:hypothetical protein